MEKTTQLFDNLMLLVRSVKTLSVLSEEEYESLSSYEAEGFMTAKMGAEAVLAAIEKVDIDKIAEYNPRKDLQPEDIEYQKIRRSIVEFGYVDPVIINKDMTVIGVRFQVIKVNDQPLARLVSGKIEKGRR